MSFSPTTLAYDRRGRTAWATFTRPAALNSLSEAALDDLAALCAEVRADDGVHALVLRGTGRAFCVGLDIDLLGRAFDDHGYFTAILRRVNAGLLELEALPVPVIAAVNGITRAGGFELSLACDFIVIADEARIGDVHTTFGVVPGGGSSARLPRVVGVQQAREILYSGRWLSGREAAAIGLALRSVPLAELDEAVTALAASFTDKPRAALDTVKRQVLRGLGVPTAEGVAAEREEFLRFIARDDNDPAEGYKAFREQRPPSWLP